MSTQKENTKCAICGKGYYVCVSCKSHSLTPWKIHTDTAEHYQVFQILRGVSLGVYTKSEAKDKLDSLNLNDVDTYLPSIQKQIQNIIEESNVASENLKDEKVDDKTEDNPVRAKSRKGNRRKS